ncbi:MAG TPA: hypothetical protein VMV94_17735 [Phycisphaerae bacterium]|nr:hypothetical protein [Phycisphaerae bacterium]
MDIVSPREIGWLAWCAPFAKTLFRMMIVITLMAPVDAVIAIVAARKGWRWTPTMLLIGILTCIVGALIAMT